MSDTSQITTLEPGDRVRVVGSAEHNVPAVVGTFTIARLSVPGWPQGWATLRSNRPEGGLWFVPLNRCERI